MKRSINIQNTANCSLIEFYINQTTSEICSIKKADYKEDTYKRETKLRRDASKHVID